MPLPKQNIRIPVDGGIGRGRDEWAIQPPKLLEATNVTFRKPGAVQKLPGFSSTGTVDAAAQGFLVSHPGRSLNYLGVGGTKTYGENVGWTDVHAEGGYHVPVNLALTVADAPRGAVSDVNIARHGTLTALVYQVAETDYDAAPLVGGGVVPPSGSEGETVTARCIILDGDGNAVWGPYDVPEIRHFPRVEAYTDGTSPAFLFFGMQGPALNSYKWSPFTESPQNVGATVADAVINFFPVVTSALAPPAPVELTANNGANPAAVSPGTYRYMYVTSGHQDLAFAGLLYWNTSDEPVMATVTALGITGAETLGVGAEGNGTIYFDTVSEAFIVYAAAHDSLYVWETDPTAYQVTAAGYWADPFIWRDHAGLVLGEAGTGGTVVTIGGAPLAAATTGLVEKPCPSTLLQPQMLAGANTLFFRDQLFSVVSSAQTRRAVFLDATTVHRDDTGPTDREYTVAPLTQGWASIVRTFGSQVQAGTVISYYTPPQTVLDTDGRVLVPVVFDPAGGSAYLDGFNDGPDTWVIDKAHAGPLNSDVAVGWVSISALRQDMVRSVVPHQSSVIVAAGDVSAYDGQRWAPVGIVPPLLLAGDYDYSPTAATYQTRLDYATLYSAGGPPALYTKVRWWAFRLVLVYTDAQGVEYRSEPSAPLAVDGMDGDDLDPCPRITVRLEPGHRRFIDNGGSLEVEVYVTERYNGSNDAGALTEDELIEEYHLAQRTPVQEDGTGFFVPDFLQIEYGPAAVHLATHNQQSIPIYTDAEELPPERPPASGVLAHAGNYLFLVPSEFPSQLWPSKPLEVGRGPEFSSSLILYAPPGSGGIVSLAAQGDRLVVLCRNGIWELFAGQGPDAFGAGSFGAFRLLHSGDGCVTHRGTVSGPFGVFFCSSSGPKILRPDGSVADVGADVADGANLLGVGGFYHPARILDVAYHDQHNEVWLVQDVSASADPNWSEAVGGGESVVVNSDQTTLVYNTGTGAWSRVTLPSYALATHLERYTAVPLLWRLRPDGLVVVEQAGYGTDHTTDYLGVVSTPWLNFGSEMGFKRCRRIGALIRSSTDATTGSFRIALAYNYVDTDIDVFDFPADTTRAFPTQVRVKPSRQKFDSIRITVQDTSVDVGEQGYQLDLGAWALVAIELEMSEKSGLMKLQQEASK